jgi:hypothetical protein
VQQSSVGQVPVVAVVEVLRRLLVERGGR